MKLKERANLFGHWGTNIAEQNTQYINKRIQKWMNIQAFESNPALFSDRLQLDHIEQDNLPALIALPFSSQKIEAESIQEHWWGRLDDIYRLHQGKTLPDQILQLLKEQNQNYGFINLAAPILSWFIEQLDAKLSRLCQRKGGIIRPEAVRKNIILALAQRLILRMTRTLTLEINVARLEGKLSGETPQERFVSFSALLLEQAMDEKLRSEYPVLFRQLLLDTEYSKTMLYGKRNIKIINANYASVILDEFRNLIEE